MKKVIFVDDSLDNINLYKIYLKKRDDIEPSFFSDPIMALEEMKKSSFSIAFVDIQMPIMDGYTFIGEMKKLKIDCPIVFALTAFSDDETILKIKQHKFKDIICKPILKNDLLNVIDAS